MSRAVREFYTTGSHEGKRKNEQQRPPQKAAATKSA
jgi:hypothetical protein